MAVSLEGREMAVRVAINGFGRIGRLVLRAAYEHPAQRDRGRRHQRSRAGRDQRASAEIRQRARPLPRRGHDRRQLDGYRPRQDPRHRRARPGEIAVEGAGRRCRARMHRHLHQARGRREAPRSRREEGHHLGPGRRRRPDGRAGRQQRRTEAVAPGHLERVLHDQLPGARSPMYCTRGSASSAAI